MHKPLKNHDVLKAIEILESVSDAAKAGALSFRAGSAKTFGFIAALSDSAASCTRHFVLAQVCVNRSGKISGFLPAHESASRYGRITFAMRHILAARQISSEVARRFRLHSRRVSSATSSPILISVPEGVLR
jgi:hypothetical protein